MRFRLPLLLPVIAISVCPAICRADDTTASDVYKKALPSVMTLEVTTADGSGNGTGFLALKDGLAITAWHVCKVATSMKAKFADGEVDDVTGVVDKDEANDIAIIRVKESGRPMLQLKTDNPDIGSKAYALGAPRGLDFSISDGIISQMREVEGGQKLQFTTPISPGNSGGPLMAGDASVIGVVVLTRTDAQNVNFAVPIRKILALDPTLPTQPWMSVKATEPHSRTFDQAIGDALVALNDANCGFVDISDRSGGRRKFRRGLSDGGYEIQLKTDEAIKTLDDTPISSGDNAQLIKELSERLNQASSGLEYEARAIQIALVKGHWYGDANEVSKAARAFFDIADASPFSPAMVAWSQTAYATSRFSPAQLYTLGLIKDTFDFSLGATRSSFYAPNTMPSIQKGSLADKLGFKSGDKVISMNDAPISSMLDVKQVIAQNRGTKTKIVVERRSSTIELDPTIPNDLSKP